MIAQRPRGRRGGVKMRGRLLLKFLSPMVSSKTRDITGDNAL